MPISDGNRNSGGLASTSGGSNEGRRFEEGLEALKKLNAVAAEKVQQSLAGVAPEMGKYLIEFAYGDVYSRPVLDFKTKQAAIISGLTALGNARPQLAFHIGGALNAGVSPREIIEIIYVTTIYAGFPAGLNGISAAREVFESRGLDVEKVGVEPGTRRQRGEQALAETSGGSGRAVLDSLADVAPEMGAFILDFSYGDIVARKVISPAWKEIASIAATVARGTMLPQLKVHIRAALNVGCSRAEIVEVIILMAVYAGFPAALNGIEAVREVFDLD